MHVALQRSPATGSVVLLGELGCWYVTNMIALNIYSWASYRLLGHRKQCCGSLQLQFLEFFFLSVK